MLFVNDLSPILFSAGPVSVRWYGLFFALGIAFAYLFLIKAFKKHGYPQSDLDSLVIYLFLGLLIGARLGQVFFYEPGYFMSNPLEIVKIWHGGLSSHGATIGLIIAYFIWTRVRKIKFSKYPDIIIIPVPLAAMCVRIGNFFNSEIIGNPTNGNFGVIFKRLGETFPRHPAQLYEGALCLGVFVVLFYLYKKYYGKTEKYFFLFLFMLLYFGGRFFLEYYKDLHGPLPGDFPLSMGQVLSILPAVAAIIYFVWIFIAKRRPLKN